MTSPDPMAEIKASFFVECEELMESLQDALQQMQDGETETEIINVVFRAVHSIKGGAGAFGLDDLVQFAHRFETAMDDVRQGRLVANADCLKVFFSSADYLSDLVGQSAREEPIIDADMERHLAALDEIIGPIEAVAPPQDVPQVPFAPVTLALDTPEPAQAGFEISFRPEPGFFNAGNDARKQLRNLSQLGEMTVQCDTSQIPVLLDFDPDAAYLGWTVQLTTDADEAAVREIFEFVDDLCGLRVTPLEAAPAADPLAALLPPELPPLIVAEQSVADDITATDVTTKNGVPGPALSDTAPKTAAPDTPTPPQAAIKEPGAKETASKEAGSKEAGPKDTGTKDTGTKAPSQQATIRVDLDRIDRLINLVGELVINQAMLSQSAKLVGLPPNSDISTGLEEFMRLTRDIQDSVMLIRAQPVKPLFQRMARIVREASNTVGKDVKLVTEGEGTEVDKTVIERLADPLTHMIRNAVDHGLEGPDDREAAGKDTTGAITLSAAHRSGRVIIEVSDDGAGINRERVLNIAKEKGLVPQDANLSPSEIDNLLFLPGFSTAAKISDLSGRGVGMDVVKTAIHALGGRISITSTPGLGSTFTISMPLTLAVLDGMVVAVADQVVVLPLNTILETQTLQSEDLLPLGGQTQVLQRLGGVVPILDLGLELGYRGVQDSYADHVALIITADDGSEVALIVDNILEQRQVVIKGLQDSFGRLPGIAAATILGDGQIALILDPVDIVESASGRTRIPPPLDMAG